MEERQKNHKAVSLTVTGADVEPVVDFEGAGFACDGGGHGLVRVVLVFRQENVQRRRGDQLSRMLKILDEDKENTEMLIVSLKHNMAGTGTIPESLSSTTTIFFKHFGGYKHMYSIHLPQEHLQLQHILQPVIN